MPGTIGRAFKISSKQAKSYGYARPNPGVTAIAAVNGRGSYTARTAMTGRGPAARQAHARSATRRQLSAAERAAFAKRMRDARQHKPNMSRSAAGKKNIKRAIATRKAWGRGLQRGSRYRVGAAAYGKSPGAAKKLSPGVYTANRRTRMLRKNRTTARRRGRVLRKSRKARRMTSNPKARRTTRRRRKKTTTAAAPKRRRRVKRRKAKTSARKSPVRRRRRRKAKASSAAPKRRRRVKRKSRKASARKSPVRRRRRRKAKASSAAPKRRRRVKRRKSRKAKAMSPNRRRRVKRRVKHRRNRRSTRRSGRRLGMFRRNQGFMTTLKEGAKVGLIVFAGVAAHKAATKLLTELVLDKVIGAVATPATPPAPAAVSGLEVLQPYKKIIAGIAVAGLGSFAANAIIKDQETKKYAIAGMWGSLLHTVIVDLLAAFGGAAGGKVAQYLSGYDDSTAYSLGAFIMPMYRPVGEYFGEGVSGMGEYFEGGTSGLGNYGMNGDMYQAQAGYGSMPDSNSGHIDPSSDLDRELTLAEAAAGVGALPSYEAAAGLGDFIGSGNKAIGARSTWIPGETNPGTWAPVTSVNRGQAATAMVPAGILQTGGGSGVFG